jgi:hypothetical protein
MGTYVYVAIVVLFLCFFFQVDPYSSLAFLVASIFGARLFKNMSSVLAFREFFLFLYAVNYLISPAISFQLPQELFLYRIRIKPEAYFLVMLPAFACLYTGTYFFTTTIFKPNFSMARLMALLNEELLKRWLLLGLVFYFIRPFFPSELAFFFYLGSMIRYVAALSLFNLDRIKYRRYLLLVIGLEVYGSISQAMFHDTAMWIIFFVLFIAYTQQYSSRAKAGYGILLLVLFLFIQSIKGEYRSRTWGGSEQAGIGTFINTSNVLLGQSENASIFAEGNLIGSLTRLNQAWIFSSVVDRMDRVGDFQDLRLIEIYLESAFLPRFLAPNKITSGNKEIFNQYSGHTINAGTSMGLGIFSDGYIAFGTVGVWIFAFFFGLLFSIVFKIVESWSTISPFFVLFIFPILNYAVRPDCELQTILGHLVKSTLVFGLIMLYYRRYFEREIEISRRLQVQ